MKTLKRCLFTTTHIYLLVVFLILTPLSPIAQASSLPDIDRDTDNDGLIEINSLVQLHAIRHDLDGDGSSTADAYNNALGSSKSRSGCPSKCKGYELTADINLDTNSDGSFGSGDSLFNGGRGWEPIGDSTSSFNAIFHGNGHTISNLTMDRDVNDPEGENLGGLFGELGVDAVVRNLGLDDVSVKAKGAKQDGPGDYGVGALAGVSRGTIYHTYSNGEVIGIGVQRNVGGLVGINFGKVLASYSSASVSGNYDIGGLVGSNEGYVVWTHATGNVRNRGFDGGGLVGDQSVNGTIAYSYSTGDVTGGFSNANPGGLISNADDGTIIQSYFDSERSNRPASDSKSKTSSQLQSPTSASGIFSKWDESTGTQTIYNNGVLTSGSSGTRSGYEKDNFGSLSKTTISSGAISGVIEKFYYDTTVDYTPTSGNPTGTALNILIKRKDERLDLTDFASLDNDDFRIILSVQGSSSTTEIVSTETSGSVDVFHILASKSRIESWFQGTNPITVRFTKKLIVPSEIDISDVWDFGTSSDLPLLSVDFDGDGTASVSEFGEQVDVTKPVIKINGESSIPLIEGTAYTDAGATVRDPRNPEYTGTVSTAISGPSGQTSFDGTVLGNWTFTYTAPADASGNTPIPAVRIVSVIARPTAQTSLFHAKYKPGNWIAQGDGYHGHNLPDKNALTDSNGVAHNTFIYKGTTYTLSNLSYDGQSSYFIFVIKEGSNNVDEQTVFADVSLVFIDENDDVWLQSIKDYIGASQNVKSGSEYCCSPFISTVPWKRWKGTDTIIDVYMIEIAGLGGSSDVDETKPVITLTGSASVSITSGSSYTDAGATVADPGNPSYSGTVSTAIRGPSGQTSFDSAVVGDWTFTYTAPADSSGNVPDAVIRTVTITASTPTPTPNQQGTIFSATFTPGNVITSSDGGQYGHRLPNKNALTDDDGNAHNTFTLSGVEYTLDTLEYLVASSGIYFRLKEGSNNVDERTVFADYSLVIVNENDETFTEEITNFINRGHNKVKKGFDSQTGQNPFESPIPWYDWVDDNTITVTFSIVKTSSLGVSLDFDGNGTFTPSQDALALYLVAQLSTNANTLSSYVHDGATETASTTITLINSLTTGTSLDFDGNDTFTPSQDALALYLATQLSANANTLSSYVYDRSSVTAASTITRINNLVTSTNG